MKSFKNLSLVALLVALVGTFAFTPAERVTVRYAVSSFDANDYTVSEALTGETLGTHYLCNASANKVCTIDSDVAPVGGKIAIADATIIENNKQFVDQFTPAQGDND